MDYRISKRAAGVTPSLTLAIDAKAKQMKAEGLDVVGFGAGEPDFSTPQHIQDAAVDAMRKGMTKYTPSSGLLVLRQAVADKFKRDLGLTFEPNQIVISCGGKHSCFNTIMALCQEGDEVIIPSPYWVSYPEMVKMAGATPVFVQGTDATEFKITAEQLRNAVTPRTKLLILNSPCNPTGSVYTREELKALADVCVEKDLYIMSDEIYEKLCYDGAQHVSIATVSPQAAERTVIVSGLSKAYSMTGWRIGITAAPLVIAKAVGAMQSHSTSNPVSFAQMGAVAALNGPQDHLPVWLQEYSRRRTYIYERLNQMPGVSCVNAKGAFYLFPNISATGMKSVEFAARLLEEEKVAVVPGIAFGSDANIRLSYATSMQLIEKGMDRMERFCKKIAK
ncbi:MAG: pyridoxal phosphate-dependent aminotransferase [Verrucomicrobia bacterium]|nr:pyridoxal phosphate-dependent aminotransferase [Verrucomicrobiota bacterium]MBR5606309.1 pyridoxal phosphate-dependent aminotransferase [Verrucomicrobiota bacterium]MBR5691906.1 pyridoxal phosphate-dependent aminotransferase [Verrucomicrobiota bacterium]MBR5738232.1 pyridoxal phosphate-dependent aminotransferase [Verrucomicrobiota bacterium]MBR5978641.1 pyridoxal phosphate-dependent aminotransferase [Verrucomicrobiota bacterium]